MSSQARLGKFRHLSAERIRFWGHQLRFANDPVAVFGISLC